MAKNFIQPGNVIDYTAGAALASGAVVLIGARIGVLLSALANGETGPAQMTGVFEIAKLSTDAMTKGALLYWDNTNSRLTLTSAGNTLAGYAWAAAGAGTTTVQCNINA
jgi:predicted RecA/RadA family phage recombinase